MNNTVIKIHNELEPMTKSQFEQKLRGIGKERYHDNCKGPNKRSPANGRYCRKR